MRKISDQKVRDIHRLLAKGLPQKEVARIVGVSVATVNKHVGTTPSPEPVPAPPESAEDIPEEIPDGTDGSIVTKWIGKVEKMIALAEAAKDYGHAASLVSRLHQLLEHQRKAAPPPKADPNENPDFIEAARRARERLHHLITTAG